MEEKLFTIVVLSLVGILYFYHFFLLIIMYFRVNVLHKIIKTSYGRAIKSLVFLWTGICVILALLIFLLAVVF
ncbi:hypothetical protein JW962_02300 [Candidatus Dojkabacteria bacterium]|nr:hypothetical protein [Candidatus Dojkabacteria bacterium]